MTTPHLFTIAADFARALAKGLAARAESGALAGDFSLADCIIYLPTRRAARGFGEAFATVLGGAALLPQFRAIGDSDEDELAPEVDELAPAISPIRRRLLLASLIRRWNSELNFAQAAGLAQSLARIMDEAETQNVSLDNLERLAPAALAQHWEQVTDFLKLIHKAWPDLLLAEKRLNPAARRNGTLQALAQRLRDHPPSGMVIAAGSTGSIPATAQLLKTIAHLPRGAVILPALDRALDEDSWDRLDPGHPQFGLKQLLDSIGASRAQVADWHSADGDAEPRALLLRECLRPAPTTDAWRALTETPKIIGQGLNGLALAAADNPAQEALVIALALRETLEHDGRTAALVTPDRNLARRVTGALARWGIAIDDSAGGPLAHASAGAFLCLLAEAADAGFAPVPLLALLKHPFATLGEDPGAFRAQARALDRALRGPRPDPGLDGISKAVAGQTGLQEWWNNVSAILAPLERTFSETQVSLSDLIAVHVGVAERLACKETAPCPLWTGLDGEAAANLISDFREGAEDLPAIEPHFYPALLRGLAMEIAVRPRPGRNRAIAILGPLEARLQSFDLTILGGLNEGTWPPAAGADPWFSRPMRETLGLPSPERGIGQAAHDFAVLAGAGQVLLTRALKADGAPTIASRWLQRLIQLTQGLGLDIPVSDFLGMARSLDDVAPGPRLPRPAPTPPVAARPRRLTVTEIETWLRDPYAIYAKHVLKLRPLDPLDDEIGPLERGNLFHRALELFIKDGGLGTDAVQRLIAIADDLFHKAEIPHAQRAVWRPRFANAARAFVDWERKRHDTIASAHLEKRGRMIFQAPAGPFELACIADRIDILKGGGAVIIDYKTGSLPENEAVVRYFAPQLPLEGAILAAGGFDGLAELVADELIYVRFSGRKDLQRSFPGTMAAEAETKLRQYIALYDEEEFPYLSRVKVQKARYFGDYDHLARVREWPGSGWSEEP